MLESQVQIQNKLGLHARASAAFASTAHRFQADVTLIRGYAEVNGKSIMGIMMLAAAKGTFLTLRTHGSDEVEAMLALETLILNRFGEAE